MEPDNTNNVYNVVFSTSITEEPQELTSFVTSPAYPSTLSLAEHSYCATISSLGIPQPQTKEHVGDLFTVIGEIPLQDGIQIPAVITSNEVLTNPSVGGIPAELENYTNFDRICMTIPSEIPFDAEEVSRHNQTSDMENLWSFGGAEITDQEDNITTIEVTASDCNASPDQDTIDGVIHDDSGSIVEVANFQNKQAKPESISDSTTNSKRTGYSKRPRKRDYIVDSAERRKHFEYNFNNLIIQLNHAISRTKCEGTLSAIFQGELYPKPVIQEIKNTVYDHSANTEDNLTNDHPYAATILTQNVSSTAVRDHQYIEKTGPAGKETDVDFEAQEQKIGNGAGDTQRAKKGRHYASFDFIQLGWKRDQTFCKAAKSMFTQKCILEERTGAVIKLSLTYKCCVFHEGNFTTCDKELARSKKPYKGVKRKLAPKPIVMNESPMQPTLLPQQPSLLIPVSYLQSPPQRPSPYTVSQIIPYQLSCSSTPDHINEKSVEHIASSTQNSTSGYSSKETKTYSSRSSQVLNTSANRQSLLRPNDASNDFNPDNIESECNVRSPMQSVSCTEMRDSFSNTEPICSICSQTEADSLCKFWIRCNDAFCYDMVHTSCVGFMISHASHLKQLPAFYCKLHR